MAVILSLASRGGFAIWGITAVLVTAGYVFNETFWAAYPNLGFSFTLLAILVALNLLGTRWAGIFQVIFVAAALGGMSVLIVMGLWGAPDTAVPSAAGGMAWKGFSLAPSLFFPFIGYELAGFLRETNGRHASHWAIPMSAGIIAAFCLFSLWCFISLSYVPSLRLQESTVPYAYVTRAIAGETGRRLMGVVLLAGSLAAANALMLAVPRLASHLPPAGLLPVIFRGRSFTLLLLGGGIALIMALGLGGSPNLPLFLKASALLWLLTYAWQHLTTGRAKGSGTISSEPAPVAILCALALVAAVVLALITDPERGFLGTYMLVVVGAMTLIVSTPYKTEKKTFRGIA